MEFSEAVPKIMEYLHEEWGPDVVLIMDEIIEKPYGWLIVYNSRAFVESGNPMDHMFSNVPFVYTKEGEMYTIDPFLPIDTAIGAIEEEHGLTGP